MKSNNKIYYSLIICFFFSISIHAQTKTISGEVSDDIVPLPGVNIIIKGTKTGTQTDFDGKYSIDANIGDILQFSYIGMETQEVIVGSETDVTVTMNPDAQFLDEIVVTGYGSQRKSDLTGSISTISAEDMTAVPVSRVDQALQGRAAGVQVTQVSGAPGAATSIRVRGGNSITGSNEPLWVIDGIVVGTNYNLNNINANDIKSVEILKDASSVAIYGSRGANGVILVTTKSGKNTRPGELEVNVNLYTSSQVVPEMPHMLTQEEQIAFTNESSIFAGAAAPFPNAPSTYPDNDFFDILMNNAPIYNVDISVAGSSENISYYNSLNYFKQEGIIIGSGIEKYIFRSNLDINLNDELKAGVRLNYSRIEKDNGNAGFGNAFGNLRTQAIYNPDGTYEGENEVVGGPWSNPIAADELNTNETAINNLLATVYLEYSPAPKWVIRSTFSPEFDNTKQNLFISSQNPNLLFVGDLGRASVRTTSSSGWNNENTVQYQSDFGEDHSVTALGGASFQKVSQEIVFTEAFGITSDAANGFNNLGYSDPTRSVISSDYSGFQIASFFGRLNYSYQDKYLLTLVGRSDGSSVFAEGNKYEFYPSVAGAWKISEESFMENQNIIQDLKLRASYGKAGNQAINPYRTRGVLVEANTTLNNIQNSGVALGRPSNPNLKWETTTSFDIALEASLFGGRIFTELNYYEKQTDDLLLDVTIPGQTGFKSQLQNIGSLENKGWEFLLNSTNVRTDNFNWKSTLTLSSNKNKILNLGGVDFIDLTVDEILGSGNTRLIVGQPVPVFTGVNYLGTWKSQAEIDASGYTDPQVVGGPRYDDLNGDKKISTEDNVILGDPTPDLTFGFENSFTYKDFDFSFYFQGTQGNEVYNLRMRNNYFNRGESTKFGDIADRWTLANPTSDILRAGSFNVTDTPSNSEYVEDGSHIRLKTVQVAYNLPVERFGLNRVKSMRVYLTGTNLLLISDFRLIDPEMSHFGRSGLGNIAQGFANGSYPNPRVFTLGLDVNF